MHRRPLSALLLAFVGTVGLAQPGTTAPDAIRIEIDGSGEIHPFSEGFAAVRRGDAMGIIDRKGRFIVPYNKYKYVGWFKNGYCKVLTGETAGTGLIDTTGKEILPCVYYSITQPGPDGFVHLSKPMSDIRELLNLRTGKRRSVPGTFEMLLTEVEAGLKEGMVEFPSGLIRVRDRSTSPYQNQALIGFMNSEAVMVITGVYEEAHSFSDGLAAVMKRDEFGERKWGFIDPSGNTVIPFQFSKEPGDFHNGLAYVEPKDGADFRCGFIDKKGELKISSKTDCPDRKGFADGYVLLRTTKDYRTTTFAMDTLGNSVALPTEGIFDGVNYHWDYQSSFKDGRVAIEANGLGLNYGVADHLGQLVIPPIYYNSGPLKCDPMSGYCRAELLQAEGKRLKGFIDGTGRFVMIEVPASKW